MWWQLTIGIAAAILIAWLLLIVALALTRPKGAMLTEALRILPDLMRLLRRLAADPTMSRAIRVRLGLLMAYLAIPIDLIPDFIPVLGYADDAIIVTLVLRSVVRHAGINAVRQRWPGTSDGFAALCRLTDIDAESDPTATEQAEGGWHHPEGIDQTKGETAAGGS